MAAVIETKKEIHFGGCPHDCPDTCAMLYEVEDGRLVGVKGNPDHPMTRGGLCVKLADFEKRHNAPDRLTHPLKRVGPKGSKQFEPISWDEALDTIETRWKAIIDEYGPERRPLNSYVFEGTPPPDSTDSVFELPMFESPIDRGLENTGFPPGIGPQRADSMYDFIGSSYTLNDHAPDNDPFGDVYPTLIPSGGGRMPLVVQPTRTWVLGTHPIYNYDSGLDSEMRWFGSGRSAEVRTNLLFLDGHVGLRIPVPGPGEDGIPPATTSDYTFLPSPDWIERRLGQP